MKMKSQSGEPYFVSALARGLEVLSCFSDGTALGMAELAGTTNIPASTVWRICFTLEKCGYIVKAEGGSKWHVAPGVTVNIPRDRSNLRD